MVDKIFEERSIIKNSLVKETCKCDVCNKTIYTSKVGCHDYNISTALRTDIKANKNYMMHLWL